MHRITLTAIPPLTALGAAILVLLAAAGCALALSALGSTSADLIATIGFVALATVAMRRASAPVRRSQRSNSLRSRLSQRQTGPFPVR